jgi:hypothetical protein
MTIGLLATIVLALRIIFLPWTIVILVVKWAVVPGAVGMSLNPDRPVEWSRAGRMLAVVILDGQMQGDRSAIGF